MSKWSFVAGLSSFLVLASSCRTRNNSTLREISPPKKSVQSEIFDPTDLGCVCELDQSNSGHFTLMHYTTGNSGGSDIQKNLIAQYADLDTCVAKKLENSTDCLLSF